MRFALNHMVAPQMSLEAFFDLAVGLGLTEVEIRNDLDGVAILDGTTAATVWAAAAKRGLTIISINALQRFNDWNETRASEARELANYARDCGAKALVLVPVNDTSFTPSTADRLAGLRDALRGLMPILQSAGLIGLVEPLGFVECSLRLKAEAVAAIDDVGGAGIFKLVHDTFHHHVAGETDSFPTRTGLVHISGVTDKSVPTASMRDPHRMLVDASDLIDNIGQIRRLVAAGYTGPLSFEPFSDVVHRRPDIAADLAASTSFITAAI